MVFVQRRSFERLLILLLVFSLGIGTLAPASPVSLPDFQNQSTEAVRNFVSKQNCLGEKSAVLSARYHSEQAVLILSDPRVTSPGRVNLYRQMFLSPGELRALSFAAPSVQNPHVVPASGSPTLFSLDECLKL